MALAFISHPTCSLHDMGRGHPERPERLAAIRRAMGFEDMDTALEFIDSIPAGPDQLSLVHDTDYIDLVYRTSPRTGTVVLDPDTSMNPHTLNAALHAAGALILGVDRVMAGENRAAFCAVRPPGHHAERGRAMGFCIFNNVAVGAAWALKEYSLNRVAIVDFDVHHGNGTEDIFRDNPAVMLCSTFQHPFYPYSGADTRSDHIINVPLPAGTSGKAFRDAFSRRCIPALEAFKPELLLISAGFDGHAEDPLAQLQLVEDDFRWITTEIRKIADRHAGGRIVSTLEGGYALDALGRSVAAHLQAL